MQVKLIVQNGKQAGKVIPVSGRRFVIGRADDCQLRAQSTLISRRHTAILIEEDLVSVEDCGSTNGTFLNDQPVKQRCELHNGDHLSVGPLAFEVQLSVDVDAKRRPKVHSVQEAAARTAATPPPAPKEEFDISGWLIETPPAEEKPARQKSEAGTDTVINRGLVETTMMSAAPESPAAQPDAAKKPADKKTEKTPPAKPVGKFQVPKKVAESSGAAADDALRQFFHRRKP
ncbi:MAG: FHA domain-containing protein [Thermoguttaceae bacterium]